MDNDSTPAVLGLSEGLGHNVPKRAIVGVLQKMSCVVWLLCYSNYIATRNRRAT